MANVEDVCTEHKVVLIGDQLVGKSSLFMRFKTGRFVQIESQTRKEAEHMKKWTKDGEDLCTGLSEDEKIQLLNAHNNLRSRAYPTATNMERMVWNAELADIAQNYAELCIFDHNPDATSQSTSFAFVGENLAITTTSQDSLNYSDLVQAWYAEEQYYDYTSNSCAIGEVCGHHIQVVWAESDNLGCGVYRCSHAENFVYPNSLNLVCNYGPAGNFRGQLPYVTGSTSCLMCPGDKPYCVNNLCSPTQSVSGEDNGDDDNGSHFPAVSLSLFLLLIVVSLFIIFL